MQGPKEDPAAIQAVLMDDRSQIPRDGWWSSQLTLPECPGEHADFISKLRDATHVCESVFCTNDLSGVLVWGELSSKYGGFSAGWHRLHVVERVHHLRPSQRCASGPPSCAMPRRRAGSMDNSELLEGVAERSDLLQLAAPINRRCAPT